jgi:phthiodiolone/phenolphthiodiolone dimycocerosates ketoreductase
MKFGYLIPVPTPRFEYMFDGTRKAEESGFDSVFYADHTVMLPPGSGNCYDAFSFLGALTTITQKLKLCTGVSDCHRFHPAFMAHKVATIDQLSKGRAMFGIGAGEKMNIDMYGLNRDKSLTKLREYVEIMRAFWTKRRVNRKSEFWGEIKKAYIQLRPVQKSPPIYIAANGPKTRQLVGEIGDGWYPYAEAPWTFKVNKKEVVVAAKKVGRDPESIDYVYDCAIAIDDDDPEKAIKKCEGTLGSYLLNPVKTNQMYPNLNLPLEYNIHNFDMSDRDAGSVFSKIDQLPESILQDANCVGTTDDVIASIEEFKKAGATRMVMMNRGPDIDKVYEIMKSKIIPYFKELDE